MPRHRVRARRGARARPRRRSSSTPPRVSQQPQRQLHLHRPRRRHAARRPRLRVPPRHQRPAGVGGLRVPARGTSTSARASTRSRSAPSTRASWPTRRPASYTWTYGRCRRPSRPRSSIDMKPEAETWLLDALFTFHSDEPDVTFECRVDLQRLRAVRLRVGALHEPGRLRVGPRGDRGRPAHVLRARRSTSRATSASRDLHVALLGVVTQFPPAPASRPAPRASPPRAARSRATTATIDFEANVADATYECSLDLEPFEPCTLARHLHGPARTGRAPAARGRHRRATASPSSRPRSTSGRSSTRPTTRRPRPRSSARRPTGTSSTLFEFAGTDDFTTRPALRVRVPRRQHQRRSTGTSARARTTCSTTTPTRTSQLAPGRAHLRGARGRRLRAARARSAEPELRGQPRPDAGHATRGRRSTDTTPPGHRRSSPARRPHGGDRGDVRVLRHRQRDARRAWRSSARSTARRSSRAARPRRLARQPGEHTLRVRARRPRRQRRPDAGAAARGRSCRRRSRRSPPGRGDARARAETASIVHVRRRPGRRDVRVLVRRRRRSRRAPRRTRAGRRPTATTSSRSAAHVNAEGARRPGARRRYEWTRRARPRRARARTPRSPPAPPASTLDHDRHVRVHRQRQPHARRPTSTFECSLDGAAFERLRVAARAHRPDARRARAAACARSTPPATPTRRPPRYTWTVVPPPATTILSGPGRAEREHERRRSRSSPTCPARPSSAGSTARKARARRRSPTPALAAGEHIFAVRATDPAGNTSLQSGRSTSGRSATPRRRSRRSPPGPQRSRPRTPRAEFTFAANEPGVTFQCALDGARLQPCTSPRDVPAAAPGRAHASRSRRSRRRCSARSASRSSPTTTRSRRSTSGTIVDTARARHRDRLRARATTTASTTAVFGVSSDDPTARHRVLARRRGVRRVRAARRVHRPRARPRTRCGSRAVDLAGNVDPTPGDARLDDHRARPAEHAGRHAT